MRLKELREAKGLTQKDLAAELKMKDNAISRYETGERQPDFNTLVVFADYFSVTTDYLLGRTHHPQVEIIPADPEVVAKEAAEDMRRASERRQAAVDMLSQYKSPEPETGGKISIDAEVKKMLSSLSDSDLMLNGQIATPEAAEYLRQSLEAVYEHAKKINKEKQKKE